MDDHVEVKILTNALRKKLGITEEIVSMLFAPKRQLDLSLKDINFFNMVKTVMIRSGGSEKRLNLRVFNDLLRELHIKLDIAKAGLAPEKIKSLIEAGGKSLSQ